MAETYFKEALRTCPESYYVQRELLRVKVTHITNMGFTKKDALLALEKHPSHAVLIIIITLNLFYLL